MAPTVLGRLAGHAKSLLASTTVNEALLRTRADDKSQANSGGDVNTHVKEVQVEPHSGVMDPHNINNLGFFVLFALIGTAIVVTGIWFFFWAKNGGFHFKEDDWEEYKSTVLRRTGPNGTILSNVTPVTDLGGGSVYKDVDDNRTVITESTGLSGVTAGPSDIGAREKRRRKQERRARENEAHDRESRHRDRDRDSEKQHGRHRSRNGGRHVGDDGVLVDEDAERMAKDHLRNYRNEKPARVGGLNREADGSVWDGSTNPTMSTASASDVSTSLLHDREHTPTTTPTKKSSPSANKTPGSNKRSSPPTATQTKKKSGSGSGGGGGGVGGIRKVYSTADRNADREAARDSERIRAEARRAQEKGRSAARASRSSDNGRVARRDFSYPEMVAEERRLEAAADRDNSHDDHDVKSDLSGRTAGNSVPGTWTGSDVSVDSGHKSYPHLIPGLRAPPKGLSRSGYRRGRQDDFAEDEP